MAQMKKSKKIEQVNVDKRKRLGMRPRAQIERKTYNVTVVTEKGEEVSCRITGRYGIYKIDDKCRIPYFFIRVIGRLRVNSRITLHSKDGIIKGIVKKITALGPSTDVEPGDKPPIKRPGGH